NGLPACEVGRVVLEAPILRTAQPPGDVQGAGKYIEKPDGQLVARLAHETTARRRPSAASTASTLSSATLGLPRSKSPTNRTPVPASPARSAWVRPWRRRAFRTAAAISPRSDRDPAVPVREYLLAIASASTQY